MKRTFAPEPSLSQPSGEFTGIAARRWIDALGDRPADERDRTLDLSEITSIDSVGVDALLEAGRAGWRLRCGGLRPSVARWIREDRDGTPWRELSRRDAGIVLLVVVGMLSLLVLLAAAFVVTQRAEREISRRQVDRVRAGLLARGGVEFAAARLAAHPQRAPSNPHDDWFYTDGEGVPLGTSTQPSYGMTWRLRGSQDAGSDTFRLKILSGNSRINVNMGDLVYPGATQPGAGGRLFTNYANASLGRMLNHLGGYLGVSGTTGSGNQATSTLGDRILASRPVGGYRSRGDLESAIGTADYELVRDYVTTAAWTPEMPSHDEAGFDKLFGSNYIAWNPSWGWDWFTTDSPGWKYAYHRRSPVDLNRAPVEILQAVLRDVAATHMVFPLPLGEPNTIASVEKRQFPWSSLPSWMLTYRVDADVAATLAGMIDTRRQTDPFDTWTEFFQFVSDNRKTLWPDDAGLTAEENDRDQAFFVEAVFANADPNNRLGKTYRWRTFQSLEVVRETSALHLDTTKPTMTSKIHLVVPGEVVGSYDVYVPSDPEPDIEPAPGWTTEFTLGSPFAFEIESLGVLADANDGLLASATAGAAIRLGGTVMATTQEDFENFLGPTTLPDGTVRTGRPTRIDTQTYPKWSVDSYAAMPGVTTEYARFAGEIRPALAPMPLRDAVIVLSMPEDGGMTNPSPSPTADATTYEDNYRNQVDGAVGTPNLPSPAMMAWEGYTAPDEGISTDGPPGGIQSLSPYRLDFDSTNPHPSIDATGTISEGAFEFRGQLTGGFPFIPSNGLVDPGGEVHYEFHLIQSEAWGHFQVGNFVNFGYVNPDLSATTAQGMPPDLDAVATPTGKKKGWFHYLAHFDANANTCEVYAAGLLVASDAYTPRTLSGAVRLLPRNSSRIRVYDHPLDPVTTIPAYAQEDVYARTFTLYRSPVYRLPSPMWSGMASWTGFQPSRFGAANLVQVTLELYDNPNGTGTPFASPSLTASNGSPTLLPTLTQEAESFRFAVRFPMGGVIEVPPLDDVPVFEDFVLHYASEPFLDGWWGTAVGRSGTAAAGRIDVIDPGTAPPPPSSW